MFNNGLQVLDRKAEFGRDERLESIEINSFSHPNGYRIILVTVIYNESLRTFQNI